MSPSREKLLLLLVRLHTSLGASVQMIADGSDVDIHILGNVLLTQGDYFTRCPVQLLSQMEEGNLTREEVGLAPEVNA